jgi:hypothetical protein
MPVDKKKNTPPDDKGAIPNVVSADQLKPEHFHQYLRAEIRDATRTVIPSRMLCNGELAKESPLNCS